MRQFMIVCGLLAVAGLTQATTVGVNTGYWDDPSSWSPAGLPPVTEKINIAANKTITLTNTATISQMALGDNSNQGSLIIDGGYLSSTTTAWNAVGYNAPCSLLITGNGSWTSSGRVDIGLFDKYDGTASFVIDSGELNVGGALRLGQSFDGVEGATPVSMSALALISGGTVTASSLSIGSLNSVMDLSGGTVIIDGNITGDVTTWIAGGQMTAYGGTGTVNASYNAGSDKTTITGISPHPSMPPFDVNQDGLDDLVHIQSENDVFSVELLLSDGNSAFTKLVLSGSAANHDSEDKWFLGDFNGDGTMDLARLWGAGGNAYCEVETTLQDGSLDLTSWAAAQGGFSASHRWFKGDFNGDGMDDLLEMPYNGTTLSLNVYLSTGSGFVRSSWWSSTGARAEKDWFFVTDVTGDGALDFVRVYESGGNTACRVYSQNGSGDAFTQSDWNPSGYAYVPDYRWYPGDYNGDGRTDFAVLRSESDIAKVDVLLSTGSGFAVGPNWINGSEPYTYGDMAWYPGDFDGDGKSDLVKIYDDGGLVSADVYLSTGSGFTHTNWVSGQGAWQDAHRFFLTDFDGDEKQDLIRVKREEYHSKVDLYLSTGTAFSYSADAYSQLERFGSLRGLPNIRKHKYFDPCAVIGPLDAADSSVFNDVCKSGQDVYLKKGAEYSHVDAASSHFIAYTPQQVFETFEADTLDEFATIVRESLTAHTFIRLYNISSTMMQNIIGDGRRYHTTADDVTNGFLKGGGHFIGGVNASHQRINRVYAINSVGQTAFKIQEPNAANRNIHRGNQIENCFVFGAGVDPRGSGRNPNVNSSWADAIGLASRDTVIRNNLVLDGTDVGIVLFTAPGSIIEDNVVATISRSCLGGINLLDTLFYDEWGIGGVGPEGRLQFDFSSLVQNNYLDAFGARIDIGIPVGWKTWTPTSDIFTNNPANLTIINNTLDGDAFGYGVAVANAFYVTASNNVSSAIHSGVGGYSMRPGREPDPASAFAYDAPHTFYSTFGPEFSAASAEKGLDFLIFNTKYGRATTPDGYIVVPYTPAEAVATIHAAFLEMLHRYPTSTELNVYTNDLISTMKRADDVRVALMQLPEFDAVNPAFSGDKSVNGMQIYRTGEWMENLKIIDSIAYNRHGNYPGAKDLYDDALIYLTGDYLPVGSAALTAGSGGINLEYEGALMTTTNLMTGGWQLADPQPGSPTIINAPDSSRFYKAVSP